MRKTRLLLFTALAVLAIAAVAVAQTTTYTLQGTATSGGSKKKPKPGSLSFGFTVTDPSGNQTPPLQTYKIMYEGGKINTGLLPACTAAKINAAQGSPAGCPAKSKVATGTLDALVGTAGTPVSGSSKCLAHLTVFAGGKGHLTLLVEAHAGECITSLSEAIDMQYIQSGNNGGVQFTVPEELRHQLGLDITVVDTKVVFKKVVVKKKGKKVGYIVSTGCPDHQRTLTVTFTDETGQQFPVSQDIGKC